MRRRPMVLLVATVLLSGCGSATLAGSGTPDAGVTGGPSASAAPSASPSGSAAPAPVTGGPDISVLAVQAHLGELEKIARAHGGNRAAGTAGYQASVAYVKAKLDTAGFRTRLVPVAAVPGTGAVRTDNLIADWPGGDEQRTLMVGAHLDSVPEGPGINDNGSGSAAILEVALAMSRAKLRPARHVRFAWWGAEEQGLIGSTLYVATLPAAERQAITGYLNFDMVGSPNAGYFVYDGDNSDGTGAGPGPAGSDRIEQVISGAFAARGVRVRGTDFDGRSDYGPFISVGIPAGGTFTGAEGVMTSAEATLWGGRANQPYDPCYHAACDTTKNIDAKALDRNSDVIATAVWTLSAR